MPSSRSSRSSSPASGSGQDSPGMDDLVSYTTHKIHVNSFDIHKPPFEVRVISEQKIAPEHLAWLIDSENSPRSVGIAPAYSKDGKMITALAISTATRILVLSIINLKDPRPGTNVKWVEGFRKHFNRGGILSSNDTTIYAFDLGPTTLQLYRMHGFHITEGVDIQSALPLTTRSPAAAIKFALGDTTPVHESNINITFRLMTFEPKRPAHLALRAWLANHIANLDSMEDTFYKAPRISTKKFSKEQLEFLSKTAHDSHQLDRMKPDAVDNEFSARWDSKNKKLHVTSERYQTRVTKSSNQKIEVQASDGSGSYVISAQAGKVDGRLAKLSTTSNLDGKTVIGMSSGQRDAPTQAEKEHSLAILQTLQGLRPIFDNPFLQSIWFSSDSVIWPESFSVDTSADDIPITPHPDFPINNSQTKAIDTMLSPSPDSCLCLVQGPPGTGKTTVIATCVLSSITAGKGGIWLVAQSNVAVKNIAEKLVDMGFDKWRLVVSKEFVLDWHEHLYKQISKNIIRSDEFPKNRDALHRALAGSQVILCTLSMLSNARLRDLGFFHAVPLRTLIIDEASQIEVGNYIPIISRNATIRKLCFIGDDKQLPPYGQEDIGDLQSIFEMSHLREKVVFLDTQYRMPPQIGKFISKSVYNNQLSSNPLHPVKSSIQACHFVDVQNSQEQHFGTSYVNVKEADAVVLLAKHFQEEDKPYRVITPYDAQRDFLEKALKQNSLDWHNKCFNVDAFQGNEDHYIIISLVRSRELGFLKNLRRTNVMLTRCKRGMFICSTKLFLQGKGAKSLAGEMAAHFGESAWLDMKDIETGNF